MNKRFLYMCKKCWHSWRSTKNYKVCPKCKSNNIDIDSEVIL